MLRRFGLDSLGVSGKEFLPAFILSVNAFAGYYLTFTIIGRFESAFNLTSMEAFTVWGIYVISVIGSSVVGSFFSSVIKRLYFLYAWMILGIMSSLLPALLNFTPYIWSCLLGFSFGVGMPVCLAYFSDSSAVENRGRMSGLIFLTVYLSVPILVIVLSLLDLTNSSILLAIWRGAGLLLFILFKPNSIANKMMKRVSFSAILKNKTTLLYFVPWIMFVFIDSLESPVFRSYLANPSISSILFLGPIVGSFSAFVGGLLSDRIGRKKVLMSGFVALGLAYAIIGIAPDELISWYFYAAVDGIAWGILLATYLLTLWGDLSQVGGGEKYYLIGGTPFFFAQTIEVFFASSIVKIPELAAFSLASFFLFIAVLPLLYAPETLPRKHIELIALKGYVEQARKTKEKVAA